MVETATAMKMAVTSSAFERILTSGDFTQLEFIEWCAREAACDIVLDVRHFPRRDDEYLAQVKKMAADLAVQILAVQDDHALASNGAAQEALRLALALGAPLVSANLAATTTCSWAQQYTILVAAARAAKHANVTLALRNVPGTFGASSSDLRHATKETDSAWLRFAPELATLEAGSQPERLVAHTVLLWAQLGSAANVDAFRNFAGFRGSLALDDESGGAQPTTARESISRWRTAIAALL